MAVRQSKSPPEVSHEFLEVVSPDVFTVRAPALGTTLKMKIRTDLVWKSMSHLDGLVGLAFSTEMMSSQTAEDGLVLLELLKTNLANKRLI